MLEKLKRGRGLAPVMDEQSEPDPVVAAPPKAPINLKNTEAIDQAVQNILSPSESSAGAFFALVVEESFGRIEKVIESQGDMVARLAAQAAKGPAPAPPAVVTVENVPAQATSFRVKVIRDNNGLISELVVSPAKISAFMN